LWQEETKMFKGIWQLKIYMILILFYCI
jgi:hypothetical protein